MCNVRRLLVLSCVMLGLGSGVPVSRLAQQTPQTGSARSNTQNPPPKPATAPTDQDVVRINTQLVQVDVTATDKKGRHVEDLTEADFELLVDGKKQPLTHFRHITLSNPVARELPTKKKNAPAAAPESMPTAQIQPADVRRTMAFIVDDLGLSFRSTEFVRETLRKFVAEQMQEGDLVAIIRTGNGLGLLEQFTSDKRLLYAAIEKLSWNPLSRDMNPTFADSSQELTEDQSERQAVLDTFEEFRQTNFTTGTLGAIGFVVQSLRSLPGRKSVILLSDGFKIFSENNDDNTTEQVFKALQNLIEMASRSSVVVYAMDAKGLQPFMPGADTGGRPGASSYSDALQSAQESLDGPVMLAKQTGGFLVTNTNDLNIGIQEAMYDQQSYYLLGFDPEDEKFDEKFHKISVRALRPGLTLRTRSGFFGVDEAEQPDASKTPQTRGQQLLATMLSPFGKRDLPVRMTPYFFNSSKDGPLVRTLFHLDASKLTFKDGPNGQKQLNLDLAAFAFDESGATADVAAQRINLTFTEEQYKQVLANGLAYNRDFPLKKPGAYQFRAVLRDDASGLTGSASQFIRVPDLGKKQLAVSGLVLTAPKLTPPVVAGKSEASESDAANETGAVAAAPVRTEQAEKTLGGTMTASPYVRRFPRTGWVQYGAAIYNAATDKKTNLPQITVQAEIYKDGKLFHQFAARQLEFSPGANPKRFDYVGRMRLNNFPPGEYLLHFIVTDALAKKKQSRAEQWMDFSVQ
ncbi:MAG: VWA domain-containing protein [Acidobacteriota bacterium]